MPGFLSNMRKRFSVMKKVFLNAFKIRSIQSTITISFTLLTISAMIFMGISLYNKFSTTAEKNALVSTSEIIDQVNTNLGYYLKGMNDISNTISEELASGPLNQGSDLKNAFKMTLRLRKDIVTLAVFSDKGELIASTPDMNLKKGLNIENEDWFRGVLNQPDRLHFSSPHVENLFKGQYRWIVSLSREVYANENGKAVKLISLVDMNFSAIDELSRKVNLGKRGYIYIIDKDGNIIYHPQQQMIYAGLKKENIDFAVGKPDGSYIKNFNGTETMISIKTVKYTDWKIVGISYYDEMVTTKKDIYYFFISLLVFSIIIVITISILISARISLPIKRLEKIMKRVEKGELDIYANVEGEDEVKQLSNTFNVMIHKIRQLMDQNIKEQEEKRKSELKALQAQINPHFLYNTLDSIVWMAENDENKGVITMVTALANLFRTSISRGEEIIFIRDEIEHARSYLIIQKIRYMDKFDFIMEVDEDVLDYKILKIILQPIIENAIYHGIKLMVDKGIIKITAGVINDKVCLQVIDNGLGMSPEAVSKILKKESEGKRRSGIGVKNVHERIQLYFGSEYGLDIKSELDVGTCVKIWLPKLGVEEG
jgi:two-component system, sensor histidine kinase YesM